jgi:hypothetical protein
MSVTTSEAVWRHSQSRGAARLVLLCIADRVNEGRIADGAWPSFNDIAKRTLLTRATITNAIRQLETLGELKVVRPERRGSRRQSRYYLPAEWFSRSTTRSGSPSEPLTTRVVQSTGSSGSLARTEPEEPEEAMATSPEVREAFALLAEKGERIGWRIERRKDLAKLEGLRNRYPTRDLVRAVSEFLGGERIKVWRKKYELLESFLVNANDVEPRRPNRTGDEMRHKVLLEPDRACGRPNCEVCATRASAGR